MPRSLRDMVIVITGASAGIGKALAIELSHRGAHLVLSGRRAELLDDLNQQLGGHHLALKIDVSQPSDCKRLIDETLHRFGRIDTLVCNAGYGFARPFEQMSDADIRDIFQTNLFGTTECCRHAIPILKSQPLRDGLRGQIMIVSSACARRGLPFFSTYAMTKAAQLSLAEGLRVELKPQNIAVTSVHPERAATEFFSTARTLSGMSAEALAKGPRQPVSSVSRAMLRAIERPCREVWPKPLSRLSLTIAVAIPAVVDFFIGRIRDEMIRECTPSKSASSTNGSERIAAHPNRTFRSNESVKTADISPVSASSEQA